MPIPRDNTFIDAHFKSSGQILRWNQFKVCMICLISSMNDVNHRKDPCAIFSMFVKWSRLIYVVINIYGHINTFELINCGKLQSFNVTFWQILFLLCDLYIDMYLIFFLSYHIYFRSFLLQFHKRFFYFFKLLPMISMLLPLIQRWGR